MSNISMLHTVAQGLDYLLPQVVFVGGSITELYATDSAATEVRPTDDVDCVIELVSYSNLNDLEEKLRKLKFINDMESGVICRWKYAGLQVDIMPDDASILGFSNEWYKKGMTHTFDYTFNDGTVIRYFEPAYFLASKFVALNDRGGIDWRGSTDFEDIIYVLDNRTNLLDELKTTDKEVVTFLKSEYEKLLSKNNLEELVACTLPSNPDEERIHFVINVIQQIVEL
jgi:predicted nucleotidyltransferase